MPSHQPQAAVERKHVLRGPICPGYLRGNLLPVQPIGRRPHVVLVAAVVIVATYDPELIVEYRPSGCVPSLPRCECDESPGDSVSRRPDLIVGDRSAARVPTSEQPHSSIECQHPRAVARHVLHALHGLDGAGRESLSVNLNIVERAIPEAARIAAYTGSSAESSHRSLAKDDDRAALRRALQSAVDIQGEGRPGLLHLYEVPLAVRELTRAAARQNRRAIQVNRHSRRRSVEYDVESRDAGGDTNGRHRAWRTRHGPERKDEIRARQIEIVVEGDVRIRPVEQIRAILHIEAVRR